MSCRFLFAIKLEAMAFRFLLLLGSVRDLGTSLQNVKATGPVL